MRSTLTITQLRKLWRFLQKWIVRACGVSLVNYRNHRFMKNRELIEEIHQVRIEGRALQSVEELVNIASMTEATLALGADVAEVGVFRGGSARIIASRLGTRTLHLFDSFEGMKTTDPIDLHRPGDFRETSLGEVKSYLADYNSIVYHQGWFPESAKGLGEKRFSFVHIDVDLYESTLDSLRFFWPRLVQGGMILSHDYNSLSCPGVSAACREFCSNIGQSIIELAGTSQCLMVKL